MDQTLKHMHTSCTATAQHHMMIVVLMRSYVKGSCSHQKARRDEINTSYYDVSTNSDFYKNVILHESKLKEA